MEEIKLEHRIKSLPYELQKKIYNYSIMHPLAKIMKDFINEIDEFNNMIFCIDSLKFKKLNFFNIIIELRHLKGYFYYEDLIEILTI